MLNLLSPLKNWIKSIDINNYELANIICNSIPAQCPFARTFYLYKVKITIPPLCKLNPIYDELMLLRFNALTYLSK